MADENEIPAQPPRGELITDKQMLAVQWMQWQNTQAFGGTKNPTSIWGSMIRNDYNAIRYYREIEEKDDSVGAALEGLTLACLSRDHNVTAADDSAKATEVHSFIKAQLTGLPNFHSVLSCLLDAVGFGFSVGEIIFDTSEGQVSLLDVHDCPQELFLFGERFTPQIGPLQFLDQPWAMSGELVPEQKFLIFSHRMRSRNRMGTPRIRNTFWLSWFKRQVLRFWLRYGEKGPGTAVVSYKDSADGNERRKALAIAESLIEAVAVAVPENFKYEKDLLQVARSQRPETYKDLEQMLEFGIYRRIQGQTLTSFGSEEGRGSQAQGRTHADTKDQYVRELCIAVAAVINRQLIRPLVLWNFGPDVPLPTWSFDLEDEEDLGKRIIVDSTAQKMGVPIPKKYMQQRYGIPDVEKGDEPLVPNVSAPGASGIMPADFSERDVPGFVKDEQHQLDNVFADLAVHARAIYKKRIEEIANSER